MKTTILRLDPYDDVLSIRDKMGWGKSTRILLVWPERSAARLLSRELDLVLLQRHSQAIGAQLALVCNALAVREHAQALGIPVYGSLRQAQNSAWRLGGKPAYAAPERKPAAGVLRPGSVGIGLRGLGLGYSRTVNTGWSAQPAARWGFFGLGLLALLALAGALLPGATLYLAPDRQDQRITLPVRAEAGLERHNLSGVIPGELLQVRVEGRMSAPTQGSLRVPDQPASGQAVFTNITAQAQSIPAGSIVRSLDDPPVRYAVLQAGRTPPGQGSSVSVPVRALEAGPQGNLPAGALGAIEGPLGLSLTVSNPSALRGGSALSLPAPTPEERQALFDSLEAQLRQTALEELDGQIESGDLLVSSTLTLTQVIEQAYIPAGNTPADQLSLSLRLEYQCLAARAEAQTALAAALLDAALPEGYAALAGTLKIETSGALAAGGWEMQASRTIEAQISSQQAAALSLGLAPQAAASQLEGALRLAAPVRVALWPWWWPRLPLLPGRIRVVVE